MTALYERGLANHATPKSPKASTRNAALGDSFIKSTGPLIQSPQPGKYHRPDLIRP